MCFVILCVGCSLTRRACRWVWQDAQEFFTYLTDRMNVELTAAMKRGQSNSRLAIGASGKSIVADLFEGAFTSEVECGSCGNVSKTIEAFMDLELDVSVHSIARRRSAGSGAPESTTLEACLQSFCKWEDLGFGYKCDACKMAVAARKRIRISRVS